MQTTLGAFHPTRFRDLAVTVEFHCNSACRFCIVQEGMNRFRGLPFERFRDIVDENLRSRKYDRVVFTGGEVTIEKGLFRFVEYARDSRSFDALRVQTNGRRLADPAFAREIVGAGINEFFVSLHGDTAAVHDDITQRPGSFDELIGGLGNLAAMDVRRITNTVITTRNVASLPGIVGIAARFGVSQMELWNYLPMEDAEDERNLIAPLRDSLPPLLKALDLCREAGITPVVKYFPRCLLGAHGDRLDNGQPDTVIVESFWDTFPKFSCLYEAKCEHSEECLGLHHPYVNKFGWEEQTLRPVPRTKPWAEANRAVEGRPDNTGEAPAPLANAHPAWQALLTDLPAPMVKRLRGIQLTRNQARYRFDLSEGGSVEAVLAARDEQSPALARSRSFNIFYVNAAAAGHAAELSALMQSFVRSVVARDDGTLSLDPRKGLDRNTVRLHALRQRAD
jgi:cyclic pyranopterin phosphate synthase